MTMCRLRMLLLRRSRSLNLSRPILFISDLHLSLDNKESVALFKKFMHGPAQNAHAIYILGDWFDAWVGADLDSHFQEAIFNELRVLVEKFHTKFYFMSGNRDFLITQKLLDSIPCERIPDPYITFIHGTKTLLTHGDQYCIHDKGYLRYRAVAQHSITRSLFLKLPKTIRLRIAQKLREKSQVYQKNKSLAVLDVENEEMIKLAHKYQVKQIIHGHVHRPKHHHHQNVERYVLGDWHQHSYYLRSEQDKNTLVYFD